MTEKKSSESSHSKEHTKSQDNQETHANNKKRMDAAKKKKIIYGSVGGVLGLFLILLVFSFAGGTDKAMLHIESGAVQIDTGDGWVTAVDDVALSVSDKVKTLNGKAVLVLYDSIVVQLDPDTEISIAELKKDNIKIKQTAGSTWNKFMSIMGVKNYEVETPTTTATVRGTEFGVTMDQIVVTEGHVAVKTIEGASVDVTAGLKTYLDETGKLVVEKLSEEDKRMLADRMHQSLTWMKDLRMKTIQEHSIALSAIKVTYDLSDSEIANKLEDIDEGRLNDRELVEKSPIKLGVVDDLLDMNDEIKDQKKAIVALESN